jgi:hypothetical protein
MVYTQNDLIDRVSAKIDEVLPPVEGVQGQAYREGPVKYIEEVLDESAKFILRNAPIVMVKQTLKKAVNHFPSPPSAFTGLLTVGGTNVVNQILTSINGVSYNINGVNYTGNPMMVTAGSNPAAGNNRRDIIVGNNLGQLQYITGSQNTNAASLDFPNTPAGTVLVLKVLILDDGSGGFNKTYLSGSLVASPSNPPVRLIYSATEKTSIIPCPADFARFISIKLSSWKVQATELIPEEDPKYRFMKNNSMHSGSETKPKAALISFIDYTNAEISQTYSNTRLAIECFSSKVQPSLLQFLYVPIIPAEQMPNDLIDATCWEAAARTLHMMNQPQRAEIARAQALKYFENMYGLVGGG